MKYRVPVILFLFLLYLIFVSVAIPLLLYRYLGIKGFWTGAAIGGIEIVMFIAGYVLVVRRCYAGD